MGRPLGPNGGRAGGGGAGRPEGLIGGRATRERSGAIGAETSGDWAAGGRVVVGGTGGADAAWEGAGGVGGADAGRLLTRREGRGAPSLGAPGGAAAGGAASLRAGAVAGLAAAEEVDAATGRRAGVTSPGGVTVPSEPPSVPPRSTLGAAAAFLVALLAFFAGAGSSGWTGRLSPSASALRRTRSAWASSIDEEWLLTPIPRDSARSRPSLLVRPSSLASS
jgi:hypothetical protein